MRWILVALLTSTGCSGPSVTRVEPGAECPAGGVRIASGSGAELICNGSNGMPGATGADGPGGMNGATGPTGPGGAQALLRQTPLALDDIRCPRGGVLVSIGLDSGGDGGIASDGVLQPAEVTSEQVICNGDDSSRVGSLVPPTQPGAFSLRLNGGVGSVEAGKGGTVIVEAGPTRGGHVKMFKTGAADASVPAPPPPASIPGHTPVIISGNVSVVASESAGLDAGTLVVRSGILSVVGADGGVSTVTSLRVSQGAILTIPAELNRIRGSCIVDGRVALSAATNSFRLNLRCDELRLSPSSVIDLTGHPASAAVSLFAEFVAAEGTIDVSGVSGAISRAAADVEIQGSRILLGGTIRARGPDSTNSTLSRPGTVRVVATSQLSSSSAIDVSAGRFLGVSGEPARGGSVTFEAPAVRQSGTITMNGGDATSACIGCIGGNGGTILVKADTLFWNSTVLGTGGAAPTGEGGSGGDIRISRFGPTGDVAQISGNIDLSGGSGELGGPGGLLNVIERDVAPGFELSFLGYLEFQARGGSAPLAGGGGRVDVLFPGPVSGGAVIVTTGVDLRGGNAVSLSDGGSTGGNGGVFYLRTRGSALDPMANWERVIVQSSVDLSGGSGASGGSGGSALFEGKSGVTVSGVVTRGGAGAEVAGGGGSITLLSSAGEVGWTSVMDVSSPAPDAGPGGSFSAKAQTVRVAQPIRAHGQPGGFLRIESNAHATSVSVSAPSGIDVSSGGAVLIDSFDVTSNWTH